MIEQCGGIPRSVADYNEIKSIGASRLSPICVRIEELQKDMMGEIPYGLFQIGDEEYLLTWLVFWDEGTRVIACHGR